MKCLFAGFLMYALSSTSALGADCYEIGVDFADETAKTYCGIETPEEMAIFQANLPTPPVFCNYNARIGCEAFLKPSIGWYCGSGILNSEELDSFAYEVCKRASS